MKIAYIGSSHRASLRRAEAFIKNFPNYEHTYVMAERYNIEYTIPYDHNLIEKVYARLQDYDLLLPMNDRFFEIILKQQKENLPNLVNKETLHGKAIEFGFNSPRQEDFADDEYVIVKPKIGSGGYSAEDFCYKKAKFEDIKFKLKASHLVQEYIDSPFSVLIQMVSNGQEVKVYGVTLLEFRNDRFGKIMCVFGEGSKELEPKYKALCDQSVEFLQHVGYDKIPGIFNIQYLDPDNRKVIHDLNVRTGPFSVELEVNGYNRPKIYRLIDFMLGESDNIIPEWTDGYYRHYAHDLQGNKMYTFPIEENLNRELLTDKKQSGMVRNDYLIYIEKR